MGEIMKNINIFGKVGIWMLACFIFIVFPFNSFAENFCDSVDGVDPVPGGTLDPCTIPKYVTPLVIPPVMKNDGIDDSYDIAVRQFRQQVLPGGIWNTVNGRNDKFSATNVWSYGPDADTPPKVAPVPASTSQFNYPAFTIEAISGSQVTVRWINDLMDEKGNFLPHLLPVDQTVHWANPPQECRSGKKETDCTGVNPEHYEGPVPIVTHLHGAHVGPESDGYPEAWWLPAANGIDDFAHFGRLFDDVTGSNPGNLGYADYVYPNSQPATTLWYHDHTLGMTRLNVYAGPAGFYLIRGGDHDGATDQSTGDPAVLPGPAPVAGEDPNFDPEYRKTIREIPIAIQDRAFDLNGKKLFYPKNRSFFEGVKPRNLKIDFAPDSDVLPTWQPEAFFNVMVVNGTSWPSLDVAQDRYRLRLLNGCNSRFLNLALFVVNNDGTLGDEISFFQIGSDQGFLRNVVKIATGVVTPLPGDGTIPGDVAAPNPDQALLMGLAERADVIVDFSGLPHGTRIRMINTGPDEPFGGDFSSPADSDTTGQVMEFVVNSDLNDAAGSTDGTTTPPEDLVMHAENELGDSDNVRDVSLNELESEVVCVLADPDTEEFVFPIKQVSCEAEAPSGLEIVPFGPTEALLGTVEFENLMPFGRPLKWTDRFGPSIPTLVTLNNGKMVTVPVSENPGLGDIEEWDIYNFSADAHPMHLHLVRFEVVSRTAIDPGDPDSHPEGLDEVQAWESGFKDTVIAYPGQITRVKAKFDIAGLYVWHCHIVEHEDNEMMRPFIVSGP